MGQLDGKIAFITGAARGQGRSHAVELAREGADVIAVDICAPIDGIPYSLAEPDDLQQTAKEVESLGRRVHTAQVDVRHRAALQEAFDAGSSRLGPVDIVIANAGVAGILGPSGQVSSEDWETVLGVNLTGVFNTVEVAVPAMVGRGSGGSLVLIGSTASVIGNGSAGSGALAYTAAKHGVIGLMRCYANLLAPHSIRVNAVLPTGVRTPMVMSEAVQNSLRSFPAMSDSITNALPVPMVEPIDVSSAILWLVAESGRYITGVALPVDAGFINKR
jgi:SDR family mycofactocin-dependent oxidoreductase